LKCCISWINKAESIKIPKGGIDVQSYMSQIPVMPVGIEQALANIIDSIAMEDAALSGILNSESELIRKTANISKSIDEMVSVNE